MNHTVESDGDEGAQCRINGRRPPVDHAIEHRYGGEQFRRSGPQQRGLQNLSIFAALVPEEWLKVRRGSCRGALLGLACVCLNAFGCDVAPAV